MLEKQCAKSYSSGAFPQPSIHCCELLRSYQSPSLKAMLIGMNGVECSSKGSAHPKAVGCVDVTVKILAVIFPLPTPAQD